MIYAIQSSQGPIKIGYSDKSPEKRLSTLQTAHWEPLTMIGWVHGTTRLEKHLHNRLRDYRLGGEWFKAEGEVLLIAQALKNGLESLANAIGIAPQEMQRRGMIQVADACQITNRRLARAIHFARTGLLQ